MSQADPDCGSFEVPDELPDLTAFYGEHSLSGPDDGDDGFSTTSTSSTTTTGGGGGENDGDGQGAYNEDQIQQGGTPADD